MMEMLEKHVTPHYEHVLLPLWNLDLAAEAKLVEITYTCILEMTFLFSYLVVMQVGCFQGSLKIIALEMYAMNLFIKTCI